MPMVKPARTTGRRHLGTAFAIYLFSCAYLEADPEAHWAYQPLRQSDPPTANLHPIDAFLDAELERRKLVTTTGTKAYTLLRRATLDLIGLPPTPAEIEAFEHAFKKNSDVAFGVLLERLLASPHYGERWGRHWLDLVRYADTSGDAADFPVPEAWKYRNYVIKSFNRDKPYDQFIREQIAGDLLSSENDEQRWEQIIGTGYLAISRRVGVSPQNLKHIVIEDTLDNLGKTFLGLTIGCARCHDHKFDAIPTKDYYALYGFFDSSVYPHPGAEHQPYRRDFVYRIGKEQSDTILGDHRAELAQWNRKERTQFALYKSFQNKVITDKNLTRSGVWSELEQIRAERARVAETFPELEIAYAISDGEGRDSHVQKQGNHTARGERVARRFLGVLGGQTLPPGTNGSGRAHLAAWIASPTNPLTARVMVNRIWQHHFGEGLVRTPSDFGVRGTLPSHPQLLDFLAHEFISSGWSVKAMHRLLMTSKAYRRASGDIAASAAVDPGNRFLWRSHRHRLDAEQLRDSILLFSGQLDLSPGKRHPFPHYLTYFYRQHEPFQEIYESRKRSVYLLQQRIQKAPYLELFDGPDGNVPLEHRGENNTALQALYFMNSSFAHEQAGAIARRLLAEVSEPGERLSHAYRTIFGRHPEKIEIQRITRHFQEVTGGLGEPGHSVWAGLIRSMISSNEFMFID